MTASVAVICPTSRVGVEVPVEQITLTVTKTSDLITWSCVCGQIHTRGLRPGRAGTVRHLVGLLRANGCRRVVLRDEPELDDPTRHVIGAGLTDDDLHAVLDRLWDGPDVDVLDHLPLLLEQAVAAHHKARREQHALVARVAGRFARGANSG